jgi:hypothetical protein
MSDAEDFELVDALQSPAGSAGSNADSLSFVVVSHDGEGPRDASPAGRHGASVADAPTQARAASATARGADDAERAGSPAVSVNTTDAGDVHPLAAELAAGGAAAPDDLRRLQPNFGELSRPRSLSNVDGGSAADHDDDGCEQSVASSDFRRRVSLGKASLGHGMLTSCAVSIGAPDVPYPRQPFTFTSPTSGLSCSSRASSSRSSGAGGGDDDDDDDDEHAMGFSDAHGEPGDVPRSFKEDRRRCV